jgi:hypothetical protein
MQGEDDPSGCDIRRVSPVHRAAETYSAMISRLAVGDQVRVVFEDHGQHLPLVDLGVGQGSGGRQARAQQPHRTAHPKITDRLRPLTQESLS